VVQAGDPNADVHDVNGPVPRLQPVALGRDVLLEPELRTEDGQAASGSNAAEHGRPRRLIILQKAMKVRAGVLKVQEGVGRQ
jgi:hypothetical protein